MEKVSLADKFALFNEHWTPKIAGLLNGQHVKLVKIKGEFIWHHHANEDELFYVVKGSFVMELHTGNIELGEGDFLIVPKGVEHKPNASEEAWIMLFEPADTLNTGEVENERSRKELEEI